MIRQVPDAEKRLVAEAIDLAGGLYKLAAAIRVSPQRLLNWGARGVPGEHCIKIENAIKGRITRYELRPDVFGPAPDRAAEPEDAIKLLRAVRSLLPLAKAHAATLEAANADDGGAAAQLASKAVRASEKLIEVQRHDSARSYNVR